MQSTEPQALSGTALDASRLQMPDGEQYAAFISYSHSDEEIADWLHRRLEAYRIPRALGVDQRRLGKFFRDRVELAASHDLGADIRDALDRSDFLILICSPRSAKSEYVAEEIRRFKETGKSDRILAVIADGEPHAASKPGYSAADECFPPALIHRVDDKGNLTDEPEPIEPIAADIRVGRDGRENGALKIIAGLLGVGLDELVQRERQAERRRRLRANVVAVTMCVLALGAVGGGALAFQAQQRAERNFATAETALNSLVFDVAADLQNVEGVSPEAIRRILGKSRSSLDTMLSSDPDNLRLQNAKAAALMQFADAYLRAGEVELAIQSLEEALRINKRMAELEPTNPILAENVAGVEIKLDEARRRVGEQGDQLAILDAAVEVSRQAVERDPSNTRSRAVLAGRLGALADHYIDLENYDLARSMFDEALSLQRQVIVEDPGAHKYRWNYSSFLYRVAILNSIAGDMEAAIGALEDGLESSRTLHQLEPENLLYRREVAASLTNLAEFQAEIGDLDSAIENIKEALAVIETVVLAEPQSTDSLFSKAVALHAAAAIFALAGQSDPAVAHAQQARAILENLLKTEPTSQEYVAMLVSADLIIADLRMADANYAYEAGDPDGALIASGEAIEAINSLLSAGGVELSVAAQAFGSHAWFALLTGNFEAAEAAARRGIDIDSKQHWILLNLAHALLFQGEVAASRAVYEDVNRSPPADPSSSWRAIVADDFRALQSAGISSDEMAEVLSSFPGLQDN